MRLRKYKFIINLFKTLLPACKVITKYTKTFGINLEAVEKKLCVLK